MENPELMGRIRRKTEKLHSQNQGNGATRPIELEEEKADKKAPLKLNRYRPGEPIVLGEERADLEAPLGRLSGPSQAELETRRLVDQGGFHRAEAAGRGLKSKRPLIYKLQGRK